MKPATRICLHDTRLIEHRSSVSNIVRPLSSTRIKLDIALFRILFSKNLKNGTDICEQIAAQCEAEETTCHIWVDRFLKPFLIRYIVLQPLLWD